MAVGVSVFIASLASMHAVPIGALLELMPTPVPDSDVRIYVRSAVNGTQPGFVLDTDYITALPQSGENSAAAAGAGVTQSFSLSSNPGLVRFGASWDAYINQGRSAATETFLAFTIGTEDLSYSFKSSYTGRLMNGDAFTHYGVIVRPGSDERPFYDDAPALWSAGEFRIDVDSTGILSAGRTYFFTVNAGLHGVLEEDGVSDSTASGSWSLTFRDVKPNAVAEKFDTLIGLSAVFALMIFLSSRVTTCGKAF